MEGNKHWSYTLLQFLLCGADFKTNYKKKRFNRKRKTFFLNIEVKTIMSKGAHTDNL